MREEKFYCDRCGKEIGLPVSRFAFEGMWFRDKKRNATITYTSMQQRERIIAESNNNISECFDPRTMSKVITESVAIETEYCHKTKTSELCPGCYREFLRFMKGGKKDDSSDSSTEC